MKKSYNVKLGERICEIRGNMSQSELAKILGVKQVSVSTWENNTRKPDIITLCNIALHFGVSADWLLGLSDVRQPSQRGEVISHSINNANGTINNGGSIIIGDGSSVGRNCMECPLLKEHVRRFSTVGSSQPPPPPQKHIPMPPPPTKQSEYADE